MKIFIVFLCAICLSCTNNSGKTHYKDFDFITIKGIDSIEKDEFKDFIEVLKEADKFIIKVTSTDFISHSYELEFIKKDGYYYRYDEPKEKDPFIKTKETFYLRNGIGMKFVLKYDEEKPHFCSISEIDFHKNKIREIGIYGKIVQTSPDLTFDMLKENNDISFINITNVYEENERLKKVTNRFNLKTKEKDHFVSYYRGYPDSKINKYHNLYRYYFGKEIR